MSTPLRVGGFLAALAAVFALAVGVGNAVGPFAEPEDEHAGDTAGHATDHAAGHGAGASDGAEKAPGGLTDLQDGYALRLAAPTVASGPDTAVAFEIVGPDGVAVTEYDVQHEKDLHLIAVRRDLTGFQHVHPERDAAGAWTTTLDLTPGQWRLFADFRASGGEPLTLGADLAVAGDYAPAGPAVPRRVAEVDGYRVELRGDLVAGEDARLTLHVERDGQPVTDLEPYLGAYGHLVALREGDLAYLHVHPDGHPGDEDTPAGPEVAFHTAVPSAGGYRLYLDFKHDGVVRTAEFAVTTEGATP